jgi:hypothetical protein
MTSSEYNRSNSRAPTKAQLAAITELISGLVLDGLQAHLTRVPSDPPGNLRLTVQDRWASMHYQVPVSGDAQKLELR